METSNSDSTSQIPSRSPITTTTCYNYRSLQSLTPNPILLASLQLFIFSFSKGVLSGCSPTSLVCSSVCGTGQHWWIQLSSSWRKQPQNVKVYFGRRIAEEHSRLRESFILERFVPSTGWIVKNLQCTEDEILATARLDAVVFNRILVFSIRIFSLAAVLCVLGILPLNYFGQDMHHVQIPSASLETFIIGNVQERSRWLWVHCVVLYIDHIWGSLPPSIFGVQAYC